ncbi:MAG: hypothetical protein VKJ06_03280 [Vampirovibrionales bacterium]|nr:hypothetical protein [Vampirovibrionales bacterium]
MTPKASSKQHLTPKQIAGVTIAGIFAVIILVAMFRWADSERYYTPGFQQEYAKAAARRERAKALESGEPESNQPSAPGFSERQMKKYKGNGYETY